MTHVCVAFAACSVVPSRQNQRSLNALNWLPLTLTCQTLAFSRSCVCIDKCNPRLSLSVALVCSPPTPEKISAPLALKCSPTSSAGAGWAGSIQLFFIDLLLKTTACFIFACYCELSNRVAGQDKQNNELKVAKRRTIWQEYWIATGDRFHIRIKIIIYINKRL